jgi:hypothetical protein
MRTSRSTTRRSISVGAARAPCLAESGNAVFEYAQCMGRHSILALAGCPEQTAPFGARIRPARRAIAGSRRLPGEEPMSAYKFGTA